MERSVFYYVIFLLMCHFLCSGNSFSLVYSIVLLSSPFFYLWFSSDGSILILFLNSHCLWFSFSFCFQIFKCLFFIFCTYYVLFSLTNILLDPLEYVLNSEITKRSFLLSSLASQLLYSLLVF